MSTETKAKKPIWDLTGEEIAAIGRQGAQEARARWFARDGYIRHFKDGDWWHEYPDGRWQREKLCVIRMKHPKKEEGSRA